jgi:diadenosine tetraphosphatase ApaH/serine/threonine PP2A family protein phosphatase
MRNEDVHNFVLRVLASRMRGERHIEKESLYHLPVHRLIDETTAVLRSEPALLSLGGSFVVVGDLHGSIDDLLQIFSTFDYPPAQSYLFLGDYVDRGTNSIEVLLVLYALKVLFPDRIYLLRGNHECEAITRTYGFKKECRTFFEKRRTYTRFCDSFTHLPVAAVVNSKIFCVHGGLSPNIDYISEMNFQIKKPIRDIGTSLAEHLLWSDPSDDIDLFAPSPRGLGCLFGPKATEQFLQDNGLALIVRAHQFCEGGAKLIFDGCLTVFSASDYCGCGNTAAVVHIHEDGSIKVGQMPTNRSDAAFGHLPPAWLIEQSVARGPEPNDPFDFLAVYIEDVHPPLLFW